MNRESPRRTSRQVGAPCVSRFPCLAREHADHGICSGAEDERFRLSEQGLVQALNSGIIFNQFNRLRSFDGGIAMDSRYLATVRRAT